MLFSSAICNLTLRAIHNKDERQRREIDKMKNWDEFFGGSVDFSGKDTKLR
jgi:hypothetical protein